MGIVDNVPHHFLTGFGLGTRLAEIIDVGLRSENLLSAEHALSDAALRLKRVDRRAEKLRLDGLAVPSFGEKREPGIEMELEHVEFHPGGPVDVFGILLEVPAGHAAEEIVPRQQPTVFERRARADVQIFDAKRCLRRQCSPSIWKYAPYSSSSV